jgi:hypothetical protein
MTVGLVVGKLPVAREAVRLHASSLDKLGMRRLSMRIGGGGTSLTLMSSLSKHEREDCEP